MATAGALTARLSCGHSGNRPDKPPQPDLFGNLVLPRRDQRTLRFNRAPSSARLHSSCARRERYRFNRRISDGLPSTARRRRCAPASFC